MILLLVRVQSKIMHIVPLLITIVVVLELQFNYCYTTRWYQFIFRRNSSYEIYDVINFLGLNY